MNQVNIVNKRANKSKKKTYCTAEKNENYPYGVSGRVTLPFNFLLSNAVKKTIVENNSSGDKCNPKKPSDKLAVNYKSVSDYYVKAMKEKPKSFVQNDDCSIFKEIRLFHNKFESKTTPLSEPKKSEFCVNLGKQLKGIRVENFRQASVRRIRELIQSGELDELSEIETDDNHKQSTRRDIVSRRNHFETVPSIPSFNFVFTTPINQRLNLVTQIDLTGYSGNSLTISPLCTINQNNSSMLEENNYSFEPFKSKKNHETALRKQTSPIHGGNIYFTPPEAASFGRFLSFSKPDDFEKRITSPVTQIYKRTKVYFTPPATHFDCHFTESPIFHFDRNIADFRERDEFMESPQNFFETPFMFPLSTEKLF